MNGFGSQIDGLPSSGTDGTKGLCTYFCDNRYLYVILCTLDPNDNKKIRGVIKFLMKH